MIYRIPEKLQKQIDRYFNLQVGDMRIPCPYYINSKATRGNLRVMSGKGTAEEIELETKVWAKVKGFALNKASKEEIRKFMIDMKIGIECSGFVYHVIDEYMQEIGKGSLISKLKFENNSLFARLRRKLRPAENVSANMLTSELNTEKVTNLNYILPGDLIRAKGPQKNAHHVGIVTEVEKDDNGQIQWFKYANSHRYYGDDNGMRYGEVVIIDPQGELKDQDWKDIHTDGKNYFYEDLIVDYEDNGIRRLNFANDLDFND